jgi:Mg2+-importing ATPase
MSSTPAADHPSIGRGARWLSWIVGAAILAVVIAAVLHVSEGREFLVLLRRAKPWWLVFALALQATTYVAQGEVFRLAPRAARSRISLAAAYELSLAKLFADQAIPTAGLSSTLLVATALQQRAVPRPIAIATILINIATYQTAYVLCLLIGLTIALTRHQANLPILLMSVLFLLFSISVITATLMVPGPRVESLAARAQRLPILKRALAFIKEVDPHLIRNPGVLGPAIAWQIAIFVLDAATVWVFVRALGTTASGAAVFASFMISNVFRTLSIVPGGLGIFEATSVWTLNVMGIAVPLALASTLLFRGVSFWLPMIPGLWISRRLTAHTRPAVRLGASS